MSSANLQRLGSRLSELSHVSISGPATSQAKAMFTRDRIARHSSWIQIGTRSACTCSVDTAAPQKHAGASLSIASTRSFPRCTAYLSICPASRCIISAKTTRQSSDSLGESRRHPNSSCSSNGTDISLPIVATQGKALEVPSSWRAGSGAHVPLQSSPG